MQKYSELSDPVGYKRLVHYTHEGQHHYRVSVSWDELDALRVDGWPIDLSRWSGKGDYARSPVLVFDDEVVEWSVEYELAEEDVFTRNQEESPYRSDLPAGPEGRQALFGLLDEILGADEYDADSVLWKYYDRESPKSDRKSVIAFERVLELGEWAPCPDVAYEWEPISPHQDNVPAELWHLGPVKLDRRQFGEGLQTYVLEHADEWMVERDWRGICASYRRGERHLEVRFANKDKCLVELADLRCSNLAELVDETEKWLAAEKERIKEQGLTSPCPHCHGIGRVAHSGGDPRVMGLVEDLDLAIAHLKGRKTKANMQRLSRAAGAVKKCLIGGGAPAISGGA